MPGLSDAHLSSHVSEDLKKLVAVEGFDLTGVACTFKIALMKNLSPLLAANVSVLDVVEDDDGVPTSLLQVNKAQADIETMLSGIAGIVPGEDVDLYFELRAASLPGDLGTAAKTTLADGRITFKGSAND